VDFGEIGVGVNGARTWKLLGPDRNGVYGGMQGIGGIEATIRESDGWIEPVINDYFGNVPATIQGGAALWSGTRLTSYGPAQGYPAHGVMEGRASALGWSLMELPAGFRSSQGQ
jgi:hypothetical protein